MPGSPVLNGPTGLVHGAVSELLSTSGTESLSEDGAITSRRWHIEF